jgi:hypothetical protein
MLKIFIRPGEKPPAVWAFLGLRVITCDVVEKTGEVNAVTRK